jgi:hypothetical protein
MTSIRDQVYALAAADTGAGGIIPLLATYTGIASGSVGASNLLGGSSSPPPPAAIAPYLYLRFDLEVPRGDWQANGIDRIEGGFAWVGEDQERAGYVRLNTLLLRLRTLYPRTRNTALWIDSATSEEVFALRCLGLGPETFDDARGLLQREMVWQYWKTYRTQAA